MKAGRYVGAAVATAVAVGVLGGGVAWGDPPAVGPAPSPLGYCGGQGAAPRGVPYSCATKLKRIGGTLMWAEVRADGIRVVVTIHLITPRAVDTPVRITHHIGKSGAGKGGEASRGVILAGSQTATLVDSAPCLEGQLDVKAVYVGRGDERGRIGGPWIRNGVDCTGTPPGGTVVTTAPVVTPASPPARSPVTTGPVHTGTLPVSGPAGDGLAIVVGGISLIVGATLLGVARKREEERL